MIDSGKQAAVRFVVSRAGRADAAVSAEIGASRRELRRLFAGGNVRVDGVVASKGDHVAAGQEIEVASLEATRSPQPVAMDIDVIFEDEHLVAINKPAALATHPLEAGERDTAANWLVARYPETLDVGDDDREAGWAHRLDRGTSGVLLAARSRPVWEALRATFASHRITKRYRALVHGVAIAGESHISLKKQGRRTVAARAGDRGALEAETRWNPERHFGDKTLLAVELVTGRTHQIRAHLALAGHPLCGDVLYGGETIAIDGQFLHASCLELEHPISKRHLIIEAPLPDDRAAFLDALRSP